MTQSTDKRVRNHQDLVGRLTDLLVEDPVDMDAVRTLVNENRRFANGFLGDYGHLGDVGTAPA